MNESEPSMRCRENYTFSHRSDEAYVMEVERKAGVTRLRLPLTTPKGGRAGGTETKRIPITRRMLWESCKKVRKKTGAAGMAFNSPDLLCNKSRIMQEYHVRFCERLEGKFLRPTRLARKKLP